jgi:D-beta-D-heptose 7-phosphate kinase / D-beta-D-heptose 1-phosphate adenosyltransferase
VQLSASAFRDCQVLVIGDVGLDRFEYGDVERISPEAPVPVVRVVSSKCSPGCAANVSANIAALGARTILVGVVGGDRHAHQLDEAIACAGREEDIHFLPVIDSSRRTTIKTRYIAGSQQLIRADQEDCRPIDASVEDEVIRRAKLYVESCNVLVLSDYNKGLVTDRLLRSILDLAAEAKKPVLVDPKRTRLSDYRGATIIKPNRKELSVSTGMPCHSDDDARKAAEQVMVSTGAMILLTRSEQGMSLFRPGAEPIHARAEVRKVFDVSGAGDTVLAVMAAALGAGIGIEHAVQLANLAAGIVVSKLGTATVGVIELIQALEMASRGFESRIVDPDSALRRREEWRRQGLVCGFTNGCFDLIHPGHISLLAQARRACNRLIVALNTDRSVKRLKGPQRPLQGELARAYVLAALEHVDLVLLFDEDTPLALIEKLKPDVLVKGADYRESEVVGGDLVKSWGGRVMLANILPNQSTTSLVRRSVFGSLSEAS